MRRRISSEGVEDLDLTSQFLTFWGNILPWVTNWHPSNLWLSAKWIYSLWLLPAHISDKPPKTYYCTSGAAEMGLLHLPAAWVVMAAEYSGSRCSVTQGGIAKYETSNVKRDGLNIKPEFCLCLQHKTDLPLFTVSLCWGIYSWNLFMWVSWQCW